VIDESEILGEMPMQGRNAARRGAVFAVAMLAGMLSAYAPALAGALSPLNGTWSGSGSIRLDGGKSESLKCKAYYSPKSDENVGLALRCASPSNKIELRAQLTAAGSHVAGNWEERTFNASGTVAGQATGNHIRLSINGGGFSGSMAVTTEGRSQVISVATQGVALKGVSVSLRRD
jgi:hypothetical protein